MRQTTTVSQKVPVADTRAWRTGLRVWAAAATMGRNPYRIHWKKPAGNSVPGRHHDTEPSNQTACDGVHFRKGAAEYDGKCLTQELPVDEEDENASHNIEKRHERHQLSHTLAMDFTPPKITRQVTPLVIRPTARLTHPWICIQQGLKAAGCHKRFHIAVHNTGNGA